MAGSVAVWCCLSLSRADVQPLRVRQYYCSSSHVGAPRAQVTAPALSQLNQYVSVKVVSGALTTAVLSKYQVGDTLVAWRA